MLNAGMSMMLLITGLGGGRVRVWAACHMMMMLTVLTPSLVSGMCQMVEMGGWRIVLSQLLAHNKHDIYLLFIQSITS